MNRKVLFILIIFFIVSCKDEEEVIPEPTVEEIRNTSINSLAGQDEKIWKIEKAILESSSSSSSLSDKGDSQNSFRTQGQIDISTNFNVIDDEFIMSSAGDGVEVLWKARFGINTSASTSSEAASEFYISNQQFSLKFESESGDQLKDANSLMQVTVVGELSVSMKLFNPDGSQLSLELVPKLDSDYPSVPENGLDFQKLFTFESDCLAGCAPGMIGSNSTNSLYIATRNNSIIGGNLDTSYPERVMKYDFATGEIFEVHTYYRDFVSKQMHIVQDKLYVMGASGVNVYNLDLIGEKIRIPHPKKLSRFGMAVQDQDMFVVGGDLDEIESNKVFKWNITTKTMTEFMTLPEPKSGARATIVDEYLYVVGGSDKYYGTNVSDKILKINTKNSADIESYTMGKAWDFTFVDKFQNLVYMSGITYPTISEEEIEFFVGVFDTRSNSFKTLNTNLPAGNSAAIYGMCVFGERLYVIYSSAELAPNGYEVYAADLN